MPESTSIAAAKRFKTLHWLLFPLSSLSMGRIVVATPEGRARGWATMSVRSAAATCKTQDIAVLDPSQP